MADIKYYFPGITLIAIAVVIVAFPEVLIAMIAATIIFAGITALYIGHKMRKGIDELEYAINSIDPQDPSADVLAMDEVARVIESISEEKEKMDEEKEDELESSLSLETPSESGIELHAEKVVVSMSEFVK